MPSWNGLERDFEATGVYTSLDLDTFGGGEVSIESASATREVLVLPDLDFSADCRNSLE